MTDMREIFESTIERLLDDASAPDQVLAAEDGAWPKALWEAFDASGFALAAVPEAAGGAGASWSDLYAIVRAAGARNAPAPIVETLLANHLLARCGLAPATAAVSIAPGSLALSADGLASGSLADVPWGRHVPQIVTLSAGASPRLLLLDTAHASCTPQFNIAGEPRDTLHFNAALPVASAALPDDLPPDVVQLAGALLRCAQTAGALRTALALSTQYATERVQFGKPIGSFQAIQHQIAVLAEHVAAANVSAEAAFAAADEGFELLPIAVAKVTACEAAGVAAAVAHAVHGAIGFTHEHSLHLTTRRLWSWRSEFGSSTYWAQRLGRAVCAGGAASLWPAVTAGALAAANTGVAAPSNSTTA